MAGVASQTQVPYISNAPVASDPRMTATQGAPATGDYSSYLGPLVSGAANLWGQQNASEAAAAGNTAAIGTQTNTMGNINSIYAPQANLGAGAFNTLGRTLGTGGGPADYSNFLNMPGYQFAVQQGTQAINRQAAAAGNLYTPNTAAAIGQYVTGTAMQDYNTYVNQLMGAAGFGAQANAQLGNLNLQTGQNIGQLQANIGQNRAGGYTGIGGFLGSPNGSGMINNAANLIGKGYNYLSGSNAAPGTPGVSDMSGFNTPADTTGLNTSTDTGGSAVGNIDPGNYWDTGGPG
jgi:hypothetical protein